MQQNELLDGGPNKKENLIKLPLMDLHRFAVKSLAFAPLLFTVKNIKGVVFK
jgi:hypothetical protein